MLRGNIPPPPSNLQGMESKLHAVDTFNVTVWLEYRGGSQRMWAIRITAGNKLCTVTGVDIN
jgi:hypothetical protein